MAIRGWIIGLTAIALGVSIAFALSGQSYWSAALYDRYQTSLTGFDPLSRCLLKAKNGAWGSVGYISPRNCYRFGPEKEFDGIYFDEFEGQFFIEGARPATHYKLKELVWLTIDDKTDLNGHELSAPLKSRIWHIKFVGRKTKVKAFYGHGGVFENEIIVDKILSARLIKSGDEFLSTTMTTWPKPIANSDNPH